MRHTFTKDERLKSKKAIGELFNKGRQRNFFPLRVFVSKGIEGHPSPVQFMVSVPKRKIKSSVKRNRIKRLIREAWRLHKHLLYEELQNKNINVMLMLIGDAEPELKLLEKNMPAIFRFIVKSAAEITNITAGVISND